MPTFAAPDGTRLAYHATGDGDPIVCLPGGPMRDSAYLGDLGGLARQRQVIFLDLRGTGDSAAPEDPSSYRCDRQVGDVEALREHLGLARMDLLGHSAGVNLAVQYLARHPANVGKVALVTPSARALGITVSGEVRRAAAQLRSDEPWFPAAFAALERITADEETDDDWEAITPFSYGRWDAMAQSHDAAGSQHLHEEAAAIFASERAFDPPTTRAALSGFQAPVLLLFGEVDLSSPAQVGAEFAELFPNATLAVQPGAGHFPWLDDADRFVATTGAFFG